MDTLASVIALVCDSPRLSEWVAEHGKEGLEREGEEMRAMVGYFKGSMGDLRWGIELVDGTGALRKARKSNIGSEEYDLWKLKITEATWATSYR